MAPATPPRTAAASLRLTLSAAALSALLGGGAGAAVPALVGRPSEARLEQVADQVAELRADAAANAVRFEEIKRRLEGIETRLAPAPAPAPAPARRK